MNNIVVHGRIIEEEEVAGIYSRAAVQGCCK